MSPTQCILENCSFPSCLCVMKKCLHGNSFEKTKRKPNVALCNRASVLLTFSSSCLVTLQLFEGKWKDSNESFGLFTLQKGQTHEILQTISGTRCFHLAYLWVCQRAETHTPSLLLLPLRMIVSPFSSSYPHVHVTLVEYCDYILDSLYK